MHPYLLARLAAERQADHRREAEDAFDRRPRRGRAGVVVVAGALRGMADWLDGGPRRTSPARWT